MIIRRIDKTRLWLTIYCFLMIFQPPFFQFGTVYISGILTVILLLNFYGKRINVSILNNSGITLFLKLVLLMTMYLLVISLIDTSFIESKDLLSNRLRCVNQLLVLTVIQLLSVFYILSISKERDYHLEDIIGFIVGAGILQAACSISAFFIPSIRAFFLANAADVYTNEWLLQRRAYGFSESLLDTFGLGMGLIASYELFSSRNKIVPKVCIIIMILFSIIVNSRMGLAILAIALLVYFIKSDDYRMMLIKGFAIVLIVFLIIYYLFPVLITAGNKSGNDTIIWITFALQEIFDAIIGDFDFSLSGLSSFSFISGYVPLSNNLFEFIFGSGHSVYGTKWDLGFATDIGYTNLLWIYGIVGTSILLLYFAYLFYYSFKSINSTNLKFLPIVVALSFFVALFKANLIGCNPGIFVIYLFCFSAIYFNSLKNEKDEL